MTLALGQQASPPEGGDGLVIRSTTALVQVRVMAEDSKGKPVTDLEKDDFEIQDDRKPQPIVIFVADRGIPAASGAVKQGATTADSGPGYAVIVLDWLNTSYPDRVRAQDCAVKLLKSFQPTQKTALYVLPEPGLLSNFTDDTAILAQLVLDVGLDPNDFDAQFGGRTPPPISLELLMLQWNKKILGSLASFDKIADSLARRPGRKSLIWISDGFPITVTGAPKTAQVSYRPHFEKLINRLNRADVGVYTIDARGLTIKTQGYLETQQEIAERTGGKAFFERNDLDEGMRLAFEDQRLGYTLAYRLPDQASAGAHEIHVRVKRPGVKLRHRESYQLVDTVNLRE